MNNVEREKLSEMLFVRVTPSMYKRLIEIATKKGVPLASYLRVKLAEIIEEEERKFVRKRDGTSSIGDKNVARGALIEKTLQLITRSTIKVGGVTVPAAIKRSELNKKLFDNYGLAKRERENLLNTLISNGVIAVGEIRTPGRPAVIYCLTSVRSCKTCPLGSRGKCIRIG